MRRSSNPIRHCRKFCQRCARFRQASAKLARHALSFAFLRSSHAKERKCYVLVTCKTGTIFQTVRNNSYFWEAALSGDINPPREPAMFETVDDSSSAEKPEPVSRARRHPVILRVSSLVVASVLSLLL